METILTATTNLPTVIPTSNWLDTSTSGPATSGHLTINASGSCCYPIDATWYPWWTYPVYYTTTARPIKLKLSEIERLRKAAKADKALKAILAKFTHQIEITVDFE